MGMADPMLSMTVEGTEMTFLEDTRATYSTLRQRPSSAILSNHMVSVVGFSGVPMTASNRSSSDQAGETDFETQICGVSSRACESDGQGPAH